VHRGWTTTLLALGAAFAAAPAHAQSGAGEGLRGWLSDDGRAQGLDLGSETAPLIAVFVEGATAYDARELASVYADRLGREADMAALVALADDITARYREDGYFLSRAVVPQDALNDGAARVVVYEGYIAELRFVGDVPERARALMADLVGRRPVNLRALDRKLALLRAIPGLRVRSAELEPDLDDPSAHILVLHLEQERAGGYVRADNRGSDDYGGWRITANAEAYSWLRPGDESGLRIVTAPSEPDRLRAFELSYATPLGDEGAFVRIEAGAGRSVDDEGEVRNLRSASARYQIPLEAGRESERALFVEAAALTIEENLAGIDTTDEELLSLAAGLTGRWRNGWGVTSYQSQVLFGRAASPLDSLRSRFDADDQYARLNVSMLHRVSIGDDFALSMRWAAQLGDGPMPRSQEMAAGGRLFGRGYLGGSLRGDSGIAGSIEARYTGLPETEFFGQPYPYVFVDGASVYNGYLGEAREDDLASWGAGVRFELIDRVSLEVEVARALIDANDGEGWRQNFNLNLDF
jgi:hemolysin activation/secretion protein